MSKSPPDTASIINPLDRNVWGAADMGEVIGKTTGQTFYLLENGLIDADKIGRQWRSTPRRLLAPGHVAASRRAEQPSAPPPEKATAARMAQFASDNQSSRRGKRRKSAPIAPPVADAPVDQQHIATESANTSAA
jgi:hypothetical protein